MVYEILYQNKQREMNLPGIKKIQQQSKIQKNIKICKPYLENKNCLSRYEFQFEPETNAFSYSRFSVFCNPPLCKQLCPKTITYVLNIGHLS